MRRLTLAIVVVATAMLAAPVLAPTQAEAQRGRSDKAPAKSAKEKKIDRLLFTAQYLYIHERDLKAAARELDKVLRLDKGNVKAGIGLAVIHVELKQPGKAIKVLTKLGKEQPKEASVWHALGRAHAATGADQSAIAAYQKAVAVNASDREALWLIFETTSKMYAQKKVDKGDVSTAAISYMRVDRNQESYRYRIVERAIIEVGGDAMALTIYDANRAYQGAFTQQGMGRINAMMAEARTGYQSCLKSQPANQRCHYGLGLVHASVKASEHYDRDKARAHFRKADKLAEAHYELGHLARLEDDFDSAKRSLKDAIKIRRDYSQALLELGIVHKLEGDDSDAVSQFEKAYNADRYSAAAEKAIAELAKIKPEHQLVRVGMLYGRMTGDVFSTDRFRAAISLVESTYGGTEPRAPELRILEAVLSRILDAADADSTIPLKVAVLKTSVINAMAMPNGNIYFTRGFLDYLKKAWPDRPINADNDVLAHVMAHEVGHVLRQHTLNSVLFQQAVKDASEPLNRAVVTHVTRLQEIEADRVGIVLASLAGYHPRGGIEFMELRGKEAEIPKHLDHPTYEERTRYLEDYWSNDVKYAYVSFQLGNRELEHGDKALAADAKEAGLHYGKAIDHFSRFRTTLKPTKRVLNNLGVAYAKRGMIEYMGRDSALERWQSAFSIEKESALKYRSVKRESAGPGTRGAAKRADIPRDLERSLELFKDALKRDPNYDRARINLGTIEVAVGRAAAANKTLRAIRRKTPMWAELALACGIVWGEQGEYGKAIAALERARKSKTVRQQATYNLARAYQLANKPAEAKATYQRYLRKWPGGAWAAAAKRSLSAL